MPTSLGQNSESRSLLPKMEEAQGGKSSLGQAEKPSIRPSTAPPSVGDSGVSLLNGRNSQNKEDRVQTSASATTLGQGQIDEEEEEDDDEEEETLNCIQEDPSLQPCEEQKKSLESDATARISKERYFLDSTIKQRTFLKRSLAISGPPSPTCSSWEIDNNLLDTLKKPQLKKLFPKKRWLLDPSLKYTKYVNKLKAKLAPKVHAATDMTHDEEEWLGEEPIRGSGMSMVMTLPPPDDMEIALSGINSMDLDVTCGFPPDSPSSSSTLPKSHSSEESLEGEDEESDEDRRELSTVEKCIAIFGSNRMHTVGDRGGEWGDDEPRWFATILLNANSKRPSWLPNMREYISRRREKDDFRIKGNSFYTHRPKFGGEEEEDEDWMFSTGGEEGDDEGGEMDEEEESEGEEGDDDSSSLDEEEETHQKKTSLISTGASMTSIKTRGSGGSAKGRRSKDKKGKGVKGQPSSKSVKDVKKGATASKMRVAKAGKKKLSKPPPPSQSILSIVPSEMTAEDEGQDEEEENEEEGEEEEEEKVEVVANKA